MIAVFLGVNLKFWIQREAMSQETGLGSIGVLESEAPVTSAPSDTRGDVLLGIEPEYRESGPEGHPKVRFRSLQSQVQVDDV